MNPLTRSRAVRLFAVAVALLPAACSDESKVSKHLKRGDKFVEAGDYDAARIEYMNAVRIDTKNVEALKKVGDIWYEQGVPLRAYPFFGAALESDPDDVDTRRSMANVYMALRGIAEARAAAAQVLEALPDDGEALLVLVNASQSPEEINDAESRLASFDPDGVDYNIAAAIVAAKRSDFTEMKRRLDNAAAADPEAVKVNLALATYYQAAGEVEKLGEALAKASAGSPPRSSTHLRYARFFADRGDRAKALEIVEGVTDQAPGYVPAWLLLTDLALAEGRHDDASAAIVEALRRDPSNPDALTKQAAIQTAKGDHEKAIEAIRKLDAMFPGRLAIKLDLARSLVREGDLVQAAAELASAIEANPTDHPSRPEAILQLAQIDLRRGEAWAAADALEKLVEEQPQSSQAQILLSQAYQAQGRLDDAADIFRGQIAGGTEHPMPHFLLGMILRQQEKPEEARAEFEKAQGFSPDDQTITFQLVELDSELGDHDAARARAQALVDRNEEDWGGHFLLGKAYAGEEKWAEAEASLSRALELKPASPTVYELLVGVYIASGRIEEAIARVERELEANPDAWGQRVLAGRLHNQQGNRESAIAHYELVVAQESELQNTEELPISLNNLAYLLAQAPDTLERAETLAAKARALRPEDPGIADTLGWVLYQRGEFPQALALIEEAHTDSPDDPEIKYHLGLTRLMMARDGSAAEALREAIADGATYGGVEDAKAKLEFLEGAAVEKLQAAVEADASDAALWSILGLALERSSQPGEAAEAFEKAAALEPNAVVAHLGLARLHSAALGDLERGQAAAARALELAPESSEAVGLRGRIAQARGEHVQAYSLLQQAARDRVAGDQWQLDLARAAYSLGKVGEARAAMEAAAEVVEPGGPEAEEVRSFLALTVGGAGDEPHALAELAETRLASHPDDVPALMVRARVAAAEGRGPEAIGVYEGILERFPQFAPAQYELAAAIVSDPEKLDRAVELASQAREALPNDPKAARTLGVARYLSGQHSPAIPLLEAADRENLLRNEERFYLGMAYAASNRIDEAKAALNQALAGDLPESMSAEARATLDGLPEPD